MKFFSTFTGVGGFELGITRAVPGAECVGYSEIENNSNMIMKYRFPGVKNYGNIRDINTSDLPDFDCLCGGFPCQTFSIAGKRLGFSDTRGTLFFDVARIAKDKRPPVLLLENVKGLLNHNQGQTFKVIIATLDELGYDAEWELLNSKYFGVPQNRERVYIVGHLRGEPWKPIFPITRTDSEAHEGSRGKKPKLEQLNEDASQGYRVYDPDEGISQTLASGAGGMGAKTGLYAIKEKLEEGKPRWGDHYKTADDISPTLMKIGQTDVAKIIVPTQLGNSEAFGNSMGREGQEAFTLRKTEPNGVVVHSLQTRNPDRPSLKINPHGGGSGHISKEEETYCLDTGNTQEIQEGIRIRRLTPIECERLQGFPDDWTEYGINQKGEKVRISDNQRYARMGNAVTVNVVAAVARRVFK
jgi:DNA (cytosine-5)-methyltransferase 1